MASRQNLIDNLISFVWQRNADGINMDIEAVPSNLGDSVTSKFTDCYIPLTYDTLYDSGWGVYGEVQI